MHSCKRVEILNKCKLINLALKYSLGQNLKISEIAEVQICLSQKIKKKLSFGI